MPRQPKLSGGGGERGEGVWGAVCVCVWVGRGAAGSGGRGDFLVRARPRHFRHSGLSRSPKGEQMSAQIMSPALFVSPPSSCLCDFLRASFLPPPLFFSFLLSSSLVSLSSLLPSILCPRVIEAAGRTVLATGGADRHLRACVHVHVRTLGDRRGFIVSVAARVRWSAGRPPV